MRTLIGGIMAYILLFSAVAGQSQTVQQKGVAYRYNGKHQRTPLGNVRIKAVSASNSSVSDPKSGAFTLGLNGLSMGKKIGKVRVTKQGMMIFNQDAVDEWNVRQQPLVLILCDVNEFQKQKRNLVAIGEREAKKKYDRKIAALKKKYDEKDRLLEEYQTRLDSIEEEYQNALEHIDGYAEVFARIDESEVDTTAQCAIELFNRGEIEESIRQFEKGDYLKKLDNALRTGEQAREMRQLADSVESLSGKDRELAVQSLRAQISAYMLQNEWTKAGELLKGLADRLNTFDSLCDFAYFSWQQRSYPESEEYYVKAQKSLVTSDDDMAAANRAMIQMNLALIYSNIQRYAESEEMYNLALNTFKELEQENPTAYEPSIAMTQMNLANLYGNTQRYAESEEMYKSALAIYERLSLENPASYEPNLAMTQLNLATLYYSTQRYA